MISLGEARATTTIHAPIESINLADWMFTLNSEEYAACADGHQSAAQGVMPSGKRVSINVEYVAGFLMVQHYLETISHRDHVRAISPNTLLWLNDEAYVLIQITWEIKVKPIDENTCEMTCRVVSETEDVAFAQRAHESAQNFAPDQAPLQLHINEETPLFAKDIERKALAGVWSKE